LRAEPRDLVRVFQPDITYVVPIFQRRYVWTLEEQWRELWDDLLETVASVVQAEQHQEAGAEVPLPNHFLGAVVLDRSLSTGHEVDERPLIDGQQRLTTLQLLLEAVRDVALALGAEQAAGLLGRLVSNDEALVEETYQKYKVWPSHADRTAFVAAMEGGAGDPDHLIVRARGFFEERVRDFANSDPSARLLQLARVMRKHVEVVVIDLEVGDNAQVIFESLNYGGRELLAIDLVKNHVFFQAGVQNLELERLYNLQWAPFDTDWWREEDTQGRLYRPRAELFLMHWLKLEHLNDIKAHRLFVEFRDLPAFKSDLPATVQRLAADRDLYRRLQDRDPELRSAARVLMSHLQKLDQNTPMPLVLGLLREAATDVPADRADRALRALDSWLIRRALLNKTTAAYNRVILDVLKDAVNDLAHADERVIAALRSQEGRTVNWPDDDELAHDLAVAAMYGRGRIAQPRLELVLRAVENAWRGLRSEAVLPEDARLQLEHMMPQTWRETWPVSANDGQSIEDLEARRDAHLHRLGNLTLVSPSMNASLSNRPWSEKRQALRDHSTALITTRYPEFRSWWACGGRFGGVGPVFVGFRGC